MNNFKYVVYVHYLNNIPIYVGSGINERANSLHNRNKEHIKDMKKEGFRCEIIFRTNSRREAFKVEYETGYRLKDLGFVKYFKHDMRKENNPMHKKSVTDFMTEDEQIEWRKNISKSIKGKKNGYRTEVTVIAPFEKDEQFQKVKFKTLTNAKYYIKDRYGFSFTTVDKMLLNKVYNPTQKSRYKYRNLKGLTVKVDNKIGNRNKNK